MPPLWRILSSLRRRDALELDQHLRGRVLRNRTILALPSNLRTYPYRWMAGC
jgi:hypothetical protein